MELERILKEKGIPYESGADGARLTTFGSGGRVRCLVRPRKKEQLISFLEIARELAVPYRVIGGGSNLLLCDEGYRGVLVRLDRFDGIVLRGTEIIAGAGVRTALLARRAAEWTLSGLEFACGIPGTLGGAVKGNAGAYGGMLSDVLVEATLLTEGGEILTLPASALDMRYHAATLPQGAILLSARLRLRSDDPSRILDRIGSATRLRRAKQPRERSAGSVFRRVGETPAALYIEETGLKGFTRGGAMLSPAHCNFIVNIGSATTEDYFAVAETVRESVWALAGVRLEYEVERLC